MKKLAYIQEVLDVQPIPNSDRIEKARVGGWWVVVKKGDFHPGDLGLYMEVDSLLPIRPEFEFLLKGTTPKKSIHEGREVEGIRLKTVKFRGQLSQGLLLPLSVFPETANLQEGADCTELLRVLLYERPIPTHLSGKVRGAFPGFLRRTDEEQVQNCLDLLEEYRGHSFYVTEKVDGSSMSSYNYNSIFSVCSRGLDLFETEENSFWQVARKHEMVTKLRSGFAVQAELAGEGVSDNRLLLRGKEMYAFYVYDIQQGLFLPLEPMEEFCAELGIPTVPVIHRDFVLDCGVDAILTMADGLSALNPNRLREGLVFRLKDSPQRVSFKAVSNAYLLKHGL